MRRITSQKEIESKKKRNNTMVGIFLLIILIFSTIGYGFVYSGRNPGAGRGSSEQSESQNQGVYLRSTIQSTKNVPVEISFTLNDFAGQPLYIVSDNPTILNEISTTLGKHASRVQQACFGPCEDDLPEKDCSENLIVWQDSPENKVHQEERCTFIEGDITAVDAFLYKILEIN